MRRAAVHTTYSQATAITGRLASSEPNLQNIPVRTPEGRRIREAFIAPPGYRMMSADYSQIELRIMAHISQDAGLLKAFAAGEDVHRATAAEVFGVPLAEVDSEQRRYAKVINFGLIYGMSAFGLAANLGIERGAAQAYIDRYFAAIRGWRPTWNVPGCRPASRAMWRRCSAAGCGCPKSPPATWASGRWPSGPPSTRRCRGRLPT